MKTVKTCPNASSHLDVANRLFERCFQKDRHVDITIVMAQVVKKMIALWKPLSTTLKKDLSEVITQ